MSLTPGSQTTIPVLDQDALRDALSSPLPPGFGNLHALNTSLDTSKNIPGVSGGIPKLYNVPPTFSQAQSNYLQAESVKTAMADNSALLDSKGLSIADQASIAAAMDDSNAGMSNYQTEMVGTAGAAPGAPGSAGFANLTSNVGMGANIEGINAATGGSSLCGFMDGIFNFLGGIGDAIGNVIGAISGAIGAIAQGISNLVSGIAGVVGDIFSGIGDAVSGMLDAAGNVVSGVFGAVGDMVSGITDAIAGAVKAIGDAITSVINGISTGIADLIGKLGSISLPSFTLNPCAKAGLDSITSPEGANALDTASGELKPPPINPGLTP